jgi:hypothetical protein
LRLGETLTIALGAKIIRPAVLKLRAFLATGLRTSSGYMANGIPVVVSGRVSRDLTVATGEHRS